MCGRRRWQEIKKGKKKKSRDGRRESTAYLVS